MPGKVEHYPVESRCNENVDVIAREVKYAVKELVANEMAISVEKELDEALRKTLHNRLSEV